MSNAYTVGDVIPFAIQVLDSTGALSNTTSASITITLPDGTTAGPFSGTNPSTGVYQYNYTTTQAGRHVALWTTTGTIAGGEPQSATVLAANPVLTVTEVKNHLGIIGTTDDDEIAAFILSAIPILEGICGPITPRVITGEQHDAGTRSIWTDFAPIASVQSVKEMVGTTQFTLTEQAVGAATSNYGFSIDDAREGRITRRGIGSVAFTFGLVGPSSSTATASVIVNYTAGRQQPSENIRFALKELLKYLWRQTKSGPESFQEGYLSQAAVSGVSEAMMTRLRLLLGPEAVRPLGIY